MRLNSSIFHTVLCLAAILHAAYGSPVPSTQTVPSSLDRRDAVPPDHSTAVSGPTLRITSSAERPSSDDEAFGPDASLQVWKSKSLVRSPKFAALNDNQIEAGLKFFVPRELASSIPEFRTIHFEYPGQQPLPVYVSEMTRTLQFSECHFDFEPAETSGTHTFRGVGVLKFFVINGKVHFGESVMTLRLKLEGNTEVQMLKIGPLENFHFVNPNPNDHSGAGLVVEQHTPPRMNDVRFGHLEYHRPENFEMGSTRGNRWTGYGHW
ncbi:hypothetical protein C8R42DRAFT_199859 [Lentinula raphanica]|nr:hypothetical protein C8R42DRAFT_199859 [Lentinula raphanica]